MNTGNRIIAITKAFDDVLKANSARLNGIEFMPDDISVSVVTRSNVRIVVAEKVMTNGVRKALMSELLDAFDLVVAPRPGYQVLRASYSYTGSETGDVTCFSFAVQENP